MGWKVKRAYQGRRNDVLGLMKNKDRKELDKARNRSCIRCGKEGETRPAHYNGFRSHSYGKGRGIKCSDIATAELCHSCDELFSEAFYYRWDGGSKSTKRSEEFLHLIMLTNIRRASES